MVDVFESVDKKYKNIQEFGFIYMPESGEDRGALVALNKKDIQFCLNGSQEMVDFFRVIFGIINDVKFCTLMPPEGVISKIQPDLRILNMGRLMIHFSNDEFDRFRSFLKSEILSDPVLNGVLATRISA